VRKIVYGACEEHKPEEGDKSLLNKIVPRVELRLPDILVRLIQGRSICLISLVCS
jgi:hypothetical protein